MKCKFSKAYQFRRYSRRIVIDADLIKLGRRAGRNHIEKKIAKSKSNETQAQNNKNKIKQFRHNERKEVTKKK